MAYRAIFGDTKPLGSSRVDVHPTLEVRLSVQESGSAVPFDEGLAVDCRVGIDSGDDGKLSLVAAGLLRKAQFEMGLGIKSLEMKRSDNTLV